MQATVATHRPVLDTNKAEGEHVRSFQLAISRLARKPKRARFDRGCKNHRAAIDRKGHGWPLPGTADGERAVVYEVICDQS